MRIGVIGAGPWAHTAAGPALTAHPDIEFVGVWARRPEQAQDLGTEVFDDVDSLIDAVDAVAFAVPPTVQAELATKALDRGKHVLLDKPIAGTLDDARRLVDAVDRAGVMSMVTLTRRFAPETREFLASLDGHDWAAATGTWLSGALLGGEYSSSTWRQEGGALMDVGPHVFDLLDCALGPITDVVSTRRDVETDTWSITLAHEDKTSSVVLSMRTPVMPSVLKVVVSGDGGVRELSDRTTAAVECYRVLLDEFLESVRTGVPHACSAQRGLHLQEVIEKVLRLKPPRR
ncbi:dehydrogenase [Rhodococcoides trifolii]|uniref:Dehydrogenase n=1 Tax=Rhodococcoides trifolii TaxID=908250 RepID=A0A917G2C4_9NOCA|nr:Gfo/Idh/MocA family oxidoreductase [Rhodococcus trifolii]GGG19037.1 dehydrogenase [Rhodococcus trifolii]